MLVALNRVCSVQEKGEWMIKKKPRKVPCSRWMEGLEGFETVFGGGIEA